MIENSLRQLIEQINDLLMDMTGLEIELGQRLRLLDHDQLTEVAYLMEDAINGHPNRPSGVHAPLARIERYIGERVQQADWRVKRDRLMQEWEEIAGFDYDIFDSGP